MALVVEDGTGKSNADAYVDVDYVSTYATDYSASPTTWTSAATSLQERAIREATLYLDQTYKMRWKGRKTDSENALDWPRSGVWDANDFLIENDVIPTQLKRACSELAIAVVSGDDLDPDISAGSGVVSEESNRLGALSESVKYIGGKYEFKQYTRVKRQLTDLITRAGRIHRA
jgi:hypothetical protein